MTTKRKTIIGAVLAAAAAIAAAYGLDVQEAVCPQPAQIEAPSSPAE